jgi:hypothetical protein
MRDKVSVEIIATKIFEIKGKKVMLDRDLAQLYGVPTKALNQAVKRNTGRFPEDFMFKLTQDEVNNLMFQSETSSSRSQFVTLKQGQNIKYLPYVFTEQGVAMLSSVLNSDRAIKVNIQIMRAFVKLKELLLTHKELAIKMAALEKKYFNHDKNIQLIFKTIKELLTPPELPKVKEKIIKGFSKD